MNPAELERLVVAGDVDGVIAAIELAPESERRAAGPAMLRLRKVHGDWPFSGRSKANEASLLALLGTGSAAQISAGRRMWRHDRAGDVLRVRPRDLLIALVPWMLDRQGWRFVRSLVRDGVIPRPTDDAYIYGMLDFALDAAVLIQEDPDLLAHEVWRLFEVEGTADHSLADHDKYSPEEKTWARVLLDHAGSEIDRDRLLDASLAALERDFPQFRAGWYSRFHEMLKPTPAERALRGDAYLRLLRSQIGPTVAMAVGALAAIQRAGDLDGERLLAHLPAAASGRAAGTAREAVRLASRALSERASLAPRALPVVAAALSHPSADVQRDALDLLERVAIPTAEAVMFAGHRADIVPSLRARFDALVPAGAPEVSAPPAPAAEPVAPTVTTAGEGRFDGLEPLAPVASLTELVELIASVLEREGPPENLERTLDGVLRFTASGQPEFERLTSAVRTRAMKLLASRASGIATWFAAMVLSWTDGREPDEVEAEPTLAAFQAARIREVACLVATGRSSRLLAVPSYAGGWIEPLALVDRLRALGDAGADASAQTLDLVQALLRLLPIRREAALASAAGLPGEIGEAVRHALGGTAVVGPTAALWAAAARARDPDRDDPVVASGHPDLGPDASIAGHYSLIVAQGRWSRQPAIDPGGPAPAASLDVPAALIWRVLAHLRGPSDQRTLVDWNRLIWPQSRRSWFAVSAALLLDNLDWWEARWHNRERLEALFERWTPLGIEAGMLLAVALQAKEPGERGLAIDAFAAGVEEDRLDPSLVVEAMARISSALEDQPDTRYPITLFRPTRLAASLQDIGRRSPRHARAAMEVAARALTTMAALDRPRPIPAGQYASMVRLIAELAAELGEEPPKSARPGLELVAGRAGEAGRLARELLAARAGTSPPEVRPEAHAARPHRADPTG